MEQLEGACTTHAETPFMVCLPQQIYEIATIVTHTMFLGDTASSQQQNTTDPVQHHQLQDSRCNKNKLIACQATS